MGEYRFNPNEHLMKLGRGDSAKDYLPVAWRLVWFRETFPQGSIETEMLHLDLDRDTEEETFAWNSEKRRSEKVIKQAKGFVIFKATVKDGLGGVATGIKTEKAASFSDFIEKAETGAIGRALAALGYGTQFAPELDEEHRIVDTPIERSQDEQQQASRQLPAISASQSGKTASPVNLQNKALMDLLAKAKAAAARMGVDWEDEKALVFGKAVPDSALTAPMIGQINTDLGKAKAS